MSSGCGVCATADGLATSPSDGTQAVSSQQFYVPGISHRGTIGPTCAASSCCRATPFSLCPRMRGRAPLTPPGPARPCCCPAGAPAPGPAQPERSHPPSGRHLLRVPPPAAHLAARCGSLHARLHAAHSGHSKALLRHDVQSHTPRCRRKNRQKVYAMLNEDVSGRVTTAQCSRLKLSF
jgi:hypothetical protein